MLPHSRALLTRLTRALLSSLMVACFLLTFGQGSQPPASSPSGTAAGVVPAARQASHVAIITIQGPIDSTTHKSVRRRIELAERAGASALVFELDTPGGELGAVLAISDAIKGGNIKNTVAWVRHQAYSGGAIIALACREIILADPATLGDALPIAFNSFGRLNSLPEHERQKFLSPIISDLVDSARRNGYDEILVQGIAARGVELWLVRHKETGSQLFVTRDEYRTIFGEDPAAGTPALPSAPSLEEAESQEAPDEAKEEDILKKLSEAMPKPPRGRRAPGNLPPPQPDDPTRYIPASPSMGALGDQISHSQELPTTRPALTSAERGKWEVVEYVSSGSGPFVFKTAEMLRYGVATETVQDDEALKAFFAAKQLLRLDRTWSEGLVAFLTMLPVRGILIVLFLIGVFVEMTNPGLVLPGAIACLALVALLAPPMLINLASWWEVAAIGAGLILIVLEIFVLPGFGVFGVLGVLLLFGGLVGTFIPQGASFADSPRQRTDMLYGVTTLILSLASAGVLMYFITKHFGSLPFLGRLVLKGGITIEENQGDPLLAAMALPSSAIRVGMTGRAVTTLRPAGQIEIDGRVIDVVSDLGYINSGEMVRVSSVSPFRIGVERA